MNSASRLSKQIIERRKHYGLSQRDLAEMSGVSARTVEAIELGKANPSVGTLERVCKPIGLVVTLSERVKFE